VRSSTSMGVKTETSRKKGFAALCSSVSNVAMSGDGIGVSYDVNSLFVWVDCLLCITSSFQGSRAMPRWYPLDDGGTERRRMEP
jgi:hypothetical protein